MSVELTEMSYEEYNRIRTGQMTPAMASEYLKEGRIALRSFRECLMEMVPGRTAPEVAAVLQEALAEAEPEADRKSIARKVRNWLSGQNHPTNREDIFCIAFALGLSEVQTSHLLGIATEYGIHYRDGREAVYAWFLRHNCSYCQARDFFLPCLRCPQSRPFRKTPESISPGRRRLSFSRRIPWKSCAVATSKISRGLAPSMCGRTIILTSTSANWCTRTPPPEAPRNRTTLWRR